MPPIAEKIYDIILLTGRSMTINEIVDFFNLHYSPPFANYKMIYDAIYREWEKDNYVFYIDDQFNDYRIHIDKKYYLLGGRMIGP